MPKDVSERIIDSPFALTTRSGSVSIGGGSGGGGATNLDALTDVTLASPANGQTLVYNSGTGQWVNSTPAAMTAHALSGAFHTGLLNWSLINFSGSSLGDLATRSHSLLTGIGVNDHHPHTHPLVGTDALGISQHTATGLTVGNVVRATGATTFAWGQLKHTELDPTSILPDQHHAQVHNITGTDHTITGSQFQVVGATAPNVLGLLTPTPAPGAAAAILRTDAAGGIQLDTNLLYVDGANNWIGVNRTPSGATLDLIAFSNADHTQRIKMKSGQTARLWRIEDLSGNELIVLDSVGNLQSGSPGFVSGLTGWQITPQGNAEFNNIWARGELHATVFVKDEVHATGGTLLVATAGTLHDDAVIDSTTVDDDVLTVYSTPAGMGVPLQVVTTSGTFTGTDLHVSWLRNTINVNDPPSGPGFYFQPGDIIRSKTEVPTGVTDFWLEVNSATQNSGYSSYSVFKRSGTDGTLPKGAALVSYGKEGDGRILLTSDLNYAPYIDVFTVGPNVWTGAAGAVVPRMRMGRLDGIGLPGVSGVTQYGMIAGKDLSDANTGYLIASNLQFSLYKVDIRLNNGVSDTGLWTADGNLSIGSNIGALATTGLQVITTGARSGDVVIGNESGGNFMRWQQATGILTVSGSLILSDPGGTVTKSYVDSQDVAYNSLAQGYGTTAQGNAQSYGDARRIVGVNGSWDSTGATSIRWGTKAAGGVALSAAFATGSARTIADHAGATVTVSTRTYLYVNVSGTGTMTMLTTTNIGTVSGVNNVLIAVCDPGDANTKACSVTVVAGSTYMSGSNIFTGSIVAANIAAGTITANKLDAATLTSTYLDPVTAAAAADATTKANTAYTDATAYFNVVKLQGVSGVFQVTGQRSMSWSSVTIRFADGTVFSVTDGSPVGLNASLRTYLYYTYNSGVLLTTTTLSSLTQNSFLIAVFDPGATTTDPGSLNIVAGSTYISGNNIVTGSILAANIKAGVITANELAANSVTATQIAADAVTATKINVANLQAVSTATGTLTIGNPGAIFSAGKTGYAGATASVAGFFLGYSGGYKFDLGNADNNLRWDGTKLLINTDSPIAITASGVNKAVFNFDDGAGSSDYLGFSGGVLSSPNFYALTLGAGTLNTANIVMDARALSSPHTMLTFMQGSFTRHLIYDNSGVLTYDGNLVASGSFISGGTLISNTNTVRIANSFTPANSSSNAGVAGDIRWDANFIYVWIGSAWRRAVLNIF